MGDYLMPVRVFGGGGHRSDEQTEIEPTGPADAFHKCGQALDHRLFQSNGDHTARGRESCFSDTMTRTVGKD